MKSSNIQLQNRGYINEEDVNKFLSLNKDELLELAKSKEAYERSIAINLLSERYEINSKLAEILCEMLVKERKLYTKIELCNALKKASKDSIKIMINYLGVIGGNQYENLPEGRFNKKSYPLPRDIIARIFAHMDPSILEELTGVLQSSNIKAVREVIDAIGFICFYNKIYKDSILDALISCFYKYKDDEIIRWKIVRALESFNSVKSIEILKDVIENDNKEAIKLEAYRSLEIMRKE